MKEKKPLQAAATRQDKLARNITASLEKSLLDIDEDTLRELKEKRKSIFSDKKPIHRKGSYIWSGLAAVIVVAIGIPIYFNLDESTNLGNTTRDESVATYYDVDPEMLEMMDMLIVLGDLIEEDADAI